MSYLSEVRALWGAALLVSVGVSVLIQDEAGRILLQKRGDDGLWGVVGGGLEPGEDFLTAAHRELLEETGLTCPNLALLPLEEGLVSGPEFYHRYPNGHEIYLVGTRAHGTLRASALAHAAPDDSGETLDLAWFELDGLPPLSSNINRANMNILRACVGLPPLPLLPFPESPPLGNHMAALRKVVGPRPLFSPGANVLVTDGRGRLLLLQHGDGDRWTLPGGGLEPGESFGACAQRELLEETGLRSGTLELLHLFAGPQYHFTYPNGDPIHNISVLYRAEGVTGELTMQAGEIDGAAWFAPDNLPDDMELSGALIRAMVQAWREGRLTPTTPHPASPARGEE
ncbi:NUDIX domain-containing protein [Deinococcus sp. YIM 134068]|uniref:NUDIX domain-containing protein n=1 Tax=Deinococcus lichenicola TaxID=3118910 RepID=UPI002F952F39